MTTQPPDYETVLDSLAHLICGDRENREEFEKAAGGDVSKSQYWAHKVPIKVYDGFELFPNMANSDDFILLGTTPNDQPIWPIDVRFGFAATSDWPPGTWQFTRVSTLSNKAWRGKIRLYANMMTEINVLIARPNGKQVSIRKPVRLLGRHALSCGEVMGTDSSASGAGLKPEAPVTVMPSTWGDSSKTMVLDEYEHNLMELAAGMSLRRHYLWSVLIGEHGSPRARFVTDKIGVREAFRLRDIPPGAKRRAALLHWVRQHWRKNRPVSQDDKAWIKAYLRGAVEYTWNGLQCSIEPSTEDRQFLSDEKSARVNDLAAS